MTYTILKWYRNGTMVEKWYKYHTTTTIIYIDGSGWYTR